MEYSQLFPHILYDIAAIPVTYSYIIITQYIVTIITLNSYILNSFEFKWVYI